jgi:hypothetical protein
VWDSQPTRVERRERQTERRAPRRFTWNGVERRSGADRRVTNQRRITLNEGYGAGWLTFESLREKRRLVPIPRHWDELPQGELRELCSKAKPVAKLEGSSGTH